MRGPRCPMSGGSAQSRLHQRDQLIVKEASAMHSDTITQVRTSP